MTWFKKSDFTCISEILYKAGFLSVTPEAQTQHSESSYYVPKLEKSRQEKDWGKIQMYPW